MLTPESLEQNKNAVMIRNYFKIAWRNLRKNKIFSLINILGLTIGITVCMMIFLFIMNEFSFDNFHKQGKNIYRLMRSYDASKQPAPWLSGPYATALLNDFPGEIKKAVRVMPSNDLIGFGTTSFNEKNVYLADPGFFSLFSFPLIKGNPATVLKEPGSIVLTKKTAKKYFGSIDNAMGKVVEMHKHRQLKVTGIAKDLPSNSHLNFDLVVPLSNYYNEPWFNVWINNNNFTYVLLDKKANKAQIEKSFPGFMDKYMGKDMERMGARFTLSLTPLKDIYFDSGSSFDPGFQDSRETSVSTKRGKKKLLFFFLF